ncbi:hypothetical protein M501DRAFT_1000008 [Patellaria atrata CBS 101060]|uniref:Uncharacterized protein n=1 Tax=Patellaria atrata CBS 101060 TaxID=1346257 RepID=A0A9P4S3U0_9PEZI|nr:hypothetical protein M501DRAFT_1000008 [Patellaria atrata CBS 101060]
MTAQRSCLIQRTSQTSVRSSSCGVPIYIQQQGPYPQVIPLAAHSIDISVAVDPDGSRLLQAHDVFFPYNITPEYPGDTYY